MSNPYIVFAADLDSACAKDQAVSHLHNARLVGVASQLASVTSEKEILYVEIDQLRPERSCNHGSVDAAIVSTEASRSAQGASHEQC